MELPPDGQHVAHLDLRARNSSVLNVRGVDGEQEDAELAAVGAVEVDGGDPVESGHADVVGGPALDAAGVSVARSPAEMGIKMLEFFSG